MKRYIKTLIVTVLLFATTVFGVSAQSVPDYYKPLIQQYIDYINNGFAQNKQNDLGTFYGGMGETGPGALSYYGYNLTDLNNDGIPELITGETESNGIAAIFTAENNTYKKLFVKIGNDNILGVVSQVPDCPGSNFIWKGDPMGSDLNSYLFANKLYQLEGSNLVFKIAYSRAMEEPNMYQRTKTILP